MISIALSTAIGAGRETVWRALTQPSELIRWDERIQESLDRGRAEVALTIDNADGQLPIEFFGSEYADRASRQDRENEGSTIYDSQYPGGTQYGVK